jgi:NAD(P)-dependent dehydrogenase (short-subunit alcohol dehydrogenase family)
MLPDARFGGVSILRQAASEQESRLAWQALPPLEGANDLGRLVPAAKPLAVTADGRPLLVGREYGDGRVLAFAGDSTWRWAMQGAVEQHRRFWRQLVLWLAKQDDTEQDTLWVRLAQRRISPGVPLAFDAGQTKADGTAVAIPANISDKAGLQNLVDQSRKAFGPIDVLVCNAASNPYFGPSSGMGDEVFEKIMRNNVLSNHWLCQMVQPDMAAKRDGAIIIVSSIGGLKGSTEIGAYCISKAADMQLARNLACEWGPLNIRVNCIAPGLIKTDFARALYEDPARKAAAEACFPLRRLGEPDDIGGIAVMLAGRAGAFITGQSIVADGGATITG